MTSWHFAASAIRTHWNVKNRKNTHFIGTSLALLSLETQVAPRRRRIVRGTMMRGWVLRRSSNIASHTPEDRLGNHGERRTRLMGGAAPKPPPLAAEAFGGNGSTLRLASLQEPSGASISRFIAKAASFHSARPSARVVPTIRLVTINPGYEPPEARHPASRVMRGDAGRHLAKATFDYDQASYEEFDYDPLGQHPQATGTLSAAFDFTVRRHCHRSGFIQPAFHAYSPSLGWWVSRDPLGEDGGLNLYAQTSNDPVNTTDSLGLVYMPPHGTHNDTFVQHYIRGNGTPMHVPFSTYDPGWTDTDFPGFIDDTKVTQPGSFPIHLTRNYDAGKAGPGRVNVDLDGTLTVSHCARKFSGAVTIEPNDYVFHSLPWGTRTFLNELSTRIGEMLPGKSYTIFFDGHRKVTDSGSSDNGPLL
jgi:RHS repeat-associated protein